MKFKKGDTLSEIASRNGTTVKRMLAANPNIKSANSIQAGQSFMLPPELSKNDKGYTGRNETNPYKGTDLKALDADQASKKNKNNSTSSVPKMRPKKTNNASNNNVSQGSTIATGKTGYSDVSQGSTSPANKKRGLFDKFSDFVKGEGNKIKKGFNSAVKETERNFGPGKNKSVSSGSSNITNSGTDKKKVDKKKNLAMQKKQQSKRMNNQMST